MKRSILIAMLAVLSGCGDSAPKDFAYTSEGIKSLSASIMKAGLSEQLAAPGTWFVEIELKHSLIGGATDWSIAAEDSFRLARRLFEKPETARIGFSFTTPEGRTWGRLFVSRESLPQNWREMTYLEFFAIADPRPAGSEATGWLCDFYAKYESARPPAGVPKSCAR